MKRFPAWCLWLVVPALVVAMNMSSSAQTPEGAKPYRKLAPGVMKSVEPNRTVDETVSRHDIVELLAIDPSFDWAKDVPFRHESWMLDFEFKVPRMIWIDLPQASGQMKRKLIWYMVYTVTNRGKTMVPVEAKDLPYETSQGRKAWEVKQADKPVLFIPEFLLEARVRATKGESSVITYGDQVLPLAAIAIQNREDHNRKLLTTPEMCREIAVGETLWGVVTWQDVNPATYRFSIYLQGLTNAYRWTDDPGTQKIVEGINRGRRLLKKTLKLNFWRPGDEYYEHEGEIRFGFPGEVDYEWVYR